MTQVSVIDYNNLSINIYVGERISIELEIYLVDFNPREISKKKNIVG